MTPTLLILALFFVTVLVAIVVAGTYFLRRQEVARLAPEGEPNAADGGGQGKHTRQESLAKALQFIGETVPSDRKKNDSVRTRLLKAGYRWPTAATIFHGLQVATALAVAGAAGWTMMLLRGETTSTLIPALCAGGFGFLMPERILERLVHRRGQRIRSAVVPAVDLMVLAIESGQSLDQTLQDVAKALGRAYPDLAEEFVFCRLEMRAGTSRADALAHLAERSPDLELRRLARLLVESDRYGASLGPALRTHSKYLRTRIRHTAQEKARKLSVKLTFPVFFLIFPSVLVVTLGPAVLQLRESLQSILNGF